MSDLVKTGDEIWSHVESAYHRYSIEKTKEEWRELNNRPKKKYLVLPSGLDKLEEMLKKEIEQAKVRQCEPFPPIEDDTYEYGSFDSLNHVLEMISSVFARFKQDIGLVNTEGKKKENGI